MSTCKIIYDQCLFDIIISSSQITHTGTKYISILKKNACDTETGKVAVGVEEDDEDP